MDNENKRLHEWLGKHWHTMKPDGKTCSGCGAYGNLVAQHNPDYSTESGFFALLSGLRAKGFEIECDSICQSRADGWDVRLYLHDVLAISNAKAHADNLPEALFKASLAALESEGTE